MTRSSFHRLHCSVDDRSHPRSGQLTLIHLLGMLAVGSLLVALFLPATRTAREPARRTQCRNNLKQIGLALHNYADQYGGFPPAYTVDTEGRPRHSWRTLILPFLDEEALYKSIDLSKPWDDPVNAEACRTRIRVYQCPSVSLPANHTAYLGSVGPDAFFHPTESRRLADIQDGISNTLMVIEVDESQAVPWMSPQDADATMVLHCGHEPRPNHAHGTHFSVVDGSVYFLAPSVSAEQRRAMITIAGGEKLEAAW